jgi:hypothetical protein
LVPQHTAQICLPSAGQPRRARRTPQRGQITWALLYNPARIHENSSERALQSLAVVVETGWTV